MVSPQNVMKQRRWRKRRSRWISPGPTKSNLIWQLNCSSFLGFYCQLGSLLLFAFYIVKTPSLCFSMFRLCGLQELRSIETTFKWISCEINVNHKIILMNLMKRFTLEGKDLLESECRRRQEETKWATNSKCSRFVFKGKKVLAAAE